jgi:putative NADH-flavin reductase
MVRVEARKDLRDLAKVAIEELAQTAVVVNRARPGASRDEELEVRDAEGVLNVDGEDAEAKGVVVGAAEAVLVSLRVRLPWPVLLLL